MIQISILVQLEERDEEWWHQEMCSRRGGEIKSSAVIEKLKQKLWLQVREGGRPKSGDVVLVKSQVR